MKKFALTIYILLSLGKFCYSQKADIANWNADIDFYHKTLEKRHINLYHLIDKKAFTLEIHKIKNKLPQLSHFQMILELMKLTHKIGGGKGDGHTAVPLWPMKLHIYPISLFKFGDDIRVVEVIKEYNQLLGKKLVSIDGIPISEIYNLVSQYTPFTENDQSSMHKTCNSITISEILFGLDIIKQKSKAIFTFADDTGNYESIVLNALSKKEIEVSGYKKISFQYPKIVPTNSNKNKKISYSSLPNLSTVYINFKEYLPEVEMNSFAEELLDHIEVHNSKNLIIDLRNNYGGNYFTGLVLARKLIVADCIDWKSGVYVLTNRATYSAAMVNAIQFRELLNAKIVGEPTGANPNGYQDLGQFSLPNSNILITYSKRLFRLQEFNTEGVQPDKLIIPDWLKYRSGIDEVLEWVIDDIEQK